MPDVVGQPLVGVEHLLKAANISYVIKKTQPMRDFFKTDESLLYVIRQRELQNCVLELTVAAKQRKEVS